MHLSGPKIGVRRAHRGHVILLVLASLVLASAACGSDSDRPDVSESVLIRDSAGIRIVENTAGPVDTLRIGNLVLAIGQEGDPRYEFDGIRFVGGLADGRVVVVDMGTHGARYYSASGEHLATVGGAGEGPGEFQFPGSAQLLPGDTLVVDDNRIRRISYLAPDMRFLTSVSYVSALGGMDEGADVCFSPGYVGVVARAPRALVLRSSACATASGKEGPLRYHHRVRIWRPESGDEAPVASMAYVEGWERPGEEGFARFGSARFLAGTIPVAWEDGILTASHQAHRVSVYDSDGAHRMEIRDAAPRRATTPAHREAWAADQDEESLASYDGVPFPDSLPAFARSLHGNGRIWALHYDVPGMTGEHWRVYEADGTRRAVVAFPVGFELSSVREGRAFGFATDDLGIQQPRVYQIEW